MKNNFEQWLYEQWGYVKPTSEEWRIPFPLIVAIGMLVLGVLLGKLL